MASVLPTLFCILEGVLISTQWAALAKVARMTPTYYGALAFQYLLAALTFLIIHYAVSRELPRISSRMLQASITLATCCYIFPGIIAVSGLARLPTVVIALAFATVPLWLMIWGLGTGKLRPAYLLMTIVGTYLVFRSGAQNNFTPDQRLASFVLLFMAVFIFSLGIALAKKHFWIHSPAELTFWAFLFSGGFFFIWGFVFVRNPPLETDSAKYLPWVLYLGIVGTGVTGFLYRYTSFHLSRVATLSLTVTVPVVTALLAMRLFPGDVVRGPVPILGFGIALVALVLAGKSESFTYWMSYFVANSMRRGDRVMCDLEGFVRMEKGAMGRIHVIDISIGGLGFRTDSLYKVADQVVISFPMGNTWTQIALECRIAHIHKGDNPEMPYVMGVEFQKLEPELRQNLVEFLARMSRLHRASGQV